MYHVYILKLKQGKYFIGHTEEIDNLIEKIKKIKIEWLKKYSFIKILKIYNNCDKFDVDKHTKKYMELYGINNVRGGTYYQLKLSKQVIEQIEKEFTILNEEIYKDIKSESVECDIIEDSFDKLEKEFDIINKCARCGSNQHYSYECFIEFTPNEIKRCKKCKEYGHLKSECPISTKQLILEKFQKLDKKMKKIINKFRY